LDEKVKNQQNFLRLFGDAIEALSESVSGTIAISHLCWDVTRSLLVRLLDHLLGVTELNLDKFVSHVELLFSLTAIAQPSKGHQVPPAWKKLKALNIESLYGVLSDSPNHGFPVLLGSAWRFRDTWVVGEISKSVSSTVRKREDESGPTSPDGGPGVPALWIACQDTRFRFEPLDKVPANTYLVPLARSRFYLVALQDLLTAIWSSRPSDLVLRWFEDGRAVIQKSWDGPTLEEITLALQPALMEAGLAHMLIRFDSSFQKCVTVHARSKNIEHKFSKYTDVIRSIEKADHIGDDTICILWHFRRRFPLTVHAALPDNGTALRSYLNGGVNNAHLRGISEFSLPALSGRPISISFDKGIIEHGKFQDAFIKHHRELHDFAYSGRRLSEEGEQFLRSVTFGDDKLGPSEVGYLLGIFGPGTPGTTGPPEGPPQGLKSLARQMHVFQIKMENVIHTLNIYTFWATPQLSAVSQGDLFNELKEDVQACFGDIVSGTFTAPATHGTIQSIQVRWRVFIAYRLDVEESKEFRTQLKEGLERVAIEVSEGSTSETMMGNRRSWAEQIRNSIKGCDALVADIRGLSREVLFELGYAIGCGKPVVHYGGSNSPQLPLWLRARTVSPNTEEVVQKMIETAKKDKVDAPKTPKSADLVLWLGHMDLNLFEHTKRTVTTLGYDFFALTKEPVSFPDFQDILKPRVLILNLDGFEGDLLLHYCAGLAFGAHSGHPKARKILVLSTTKDVSKVCAVAIHSARPLLEVISPQELVDKVRDFCPQKPLRP